MKRFSIKINFYFKDLNSFSENQEVRFSLFFTFLKITSFRNRVFTRIGKTDCLKLPKTSIDSSNVQGFFVQIGWRILYQSFLFPKKTLYAPGPRWQFLRISIQSYHTISYQFWIWIYYQWAALMQCWCASARAETSSATIDNHEISILSMVLAIANSEP